jgi:antirestriction protein ArdC
MTTKERVAPQGHPTQNDAPKANKAFQLLTESVTALMNSDAYKRALEFRSKFYQYSFGNCWLIYHQCPTATLVAGFRHWRELGRHVKKGEKGISILAPVTYKGENEDGEETKMLRGFRNAYLFDVSQTEGDELPNIISPKLLEGDSSAIQLLIASAKQHAKETGITVTFEDTGTALGRYRPKENHILLRPDLPPLQTLKTFVHELAHATLHQISFIQTERHIEELEAESTAYLTLYELGLDTSEYSFPYLAHWAHDPKELLAIGDRAYKTSQELLGAIKKYLPNDALALAA